MQLSGDKLCTSLCRLGELRRAVSRTGEAPSPEERKDALLGTRLQVCTDCREMVLQVIRTQKTARRLQMTQSLFLNLSLSYKEELH